jgi:DNA-binding MarR family transcriptional regulator
MINSNRPDKKNISRKPPHRSSSTHADSQEPETLLASSGFLLARLGMESRKRFAQMMARHELATHHFGLLMALGEQDILPQLQLSQIMGVDPRNAVPIIDELERNGLIERQPDPQDRRRYNVGITPTGRKVMRDISRSGAKLEREFLKPLSETEQSKLHSLLLKLFLENCESI